MQAPWKRAAWITLAASCAAAAIGCKQPTEMADDSIRAQLVAAHEQANKPGQEPSTTVSYFQKATTIAAGSDMTKAQAQLELAHANERAADELIRKIESRQAEIVKLAMLIQQQAARISANNVQIAALKALEPKGAQAELDKQTAAAQGGSDGAPWVAGDAAPIPSSAGAKQQVSTLKDTIDKLTTQKNNLQTQRAQLLQQAEQLRNQSDGAKGKQSVDLFVQSADLTKQAGVLAVQSDTLDAQIATAKQDLALAQAAQTQLDAAIDALNKQSAAIKQGWTDMQKVIQERADLSTLLLTSPSADSAAPAAPADATAAPAAAPADASAAAPTTAPAATADSSIAGAAAVIDHLKSDNATSREQAEKYLNDAMNALKSAGTASQQLVRAYTLDVNDMRFKDFPQRDAWQAMIDVHNPSDVKLAMALDQLRLARLYSDGATTTANRALAAKLLDAALTPASLTGPDTLKAGALDNDLAQEKKQADDAYAEADGLLTEIAGASGAGMLAKSAKETAQAVQVVEIYARGQFAAAMGDQKSAQSLVSQSKRARDDAVAANIQLPPLPSELAAPAEAASPVAPTTSPAAAPAGAPATPSTTGPVLDTNPPPVTPAPATPAPATPAPGAAPQ